MILSASSEAQTKLGLQPFQNLSFSPGCGLPELFVTTSRLGDSNRLLGCGLKFQAHPKHKMMCERIRSNPATRDIFPI
jgi:hypothetical protein